MNTFIAILILATYTYYSSCLPVMMAVAGGCALAYTLLSSTVASGAPPMSTRRKLMAASWSPPSEGTVFGVLNVNAEALMKYIAKLAAKGEKVSVTTCVIKAIGLGLRDAPGINCRLVFGRFIPRSSIDVSCLVSVDGGSDLAQAKVGNADCKSLQDISGELKAKADKLRKHMDKDFEASKPLMSKLPVWVLRPIVYVVGFLAGALGLNIPALGVRPYPFGSALVTSVGMLGVEQAFVPFTPFTRVPLLMMVGEVTKRAVVAEDGKTIVARDMLTLTGTIDHRFADGTEAARLSKKIKMVLENPDMLEQVDPLPSGSSSASSRKK